MSLHVTSEIGKVTSVLIHLPGPEIDRMIPAMMEELLFDDILFGARAREEHRRFQQVLSFVADEVLDAQTLLAEVLETHRDEILEDLGRTLGWGPDMDYRLRELPPKELAAALVVGIEKPASAEAVTADDLYWLPPLPNYFFQRDPLVVVGDRSIRGSMATAARQREPLLSGYVFRHHPKLAGPAGQDPFWFDEFPMSYAPSASYARMRPTLEGGDVLVLREDVLLIGYSERTEKTTVERLAETLKAKKSPIKRLFVVAVPPERSYMHLDTVFTAISRDECLVYGPMILAGGAEEADVYEVDLGKREVTWTSEKDLLSALKSQKIDLQPRLCGGADPIVQRREQWTDGANAFALAPGIVLMYDRNVQTAEELHGHGYSVIEESDLLLGRSELDLRDGKKSVILLAAHELSRARGGPRCMAMPLRREDA